MFKKNGEQYCTTKSAFQSWIVFFQRYTSMVSVPFLLGFYLTIIANRWWQQYLTIPWPDRLTLAMSMYVGRSNDQSAKQLRYVLNRRCLLMLVLLFRHISETVRERFPTYQDLVQYGMKTFCCSVAYQ